MKPAWAGRRYDSVGSTPRNRRVGGKGAKAGGGDPGSVGTLAVVLGDQLDADARLLRELDTGRDAVLMMEVSAESRHVPSHVQRTVLFLSAMRHFAADLEARGVRVHYVRLGDPDNTGSLGGELERWITLLSPARVACTHPGEWRVLRELEEAAARAGATLEVLPDEHFIASTKRFSAWAEGRTALTMEFFYREQRRATGYLMEGDQPEGGAWNFDKDNRLPFGKDGPKPMPPLPKRFAPDAVTRAVIAEVREHLPGLPGKVDEASFGWYVTRAQSLEALDDFIARRLANFGPYEDAMWTGARFLYHSVLSPALNLKLLNPRECCEKAIAAYRKGRAPLQSVEGFVRQIIGWREFIRGVYWLEGEAYGARNGLDQHGSLPDFYWTGRTDMACMRECLGQVIEHAYGHHIQRLMVTGNFALIAGVHPRLISDWYLAMYADAVDWVTLPNTLGMVMHADRRAEDRAATGVVGTKPYAASGNYINRMSNYCSRCAYDVDQRTGEKACPFNTFYWDFLIRTQPVFAKNQRMKMILKNVERMTAEQKVQITVSAARLRERFGIVPSDGKTTWGGAPERAAEREGLWE